MLKRDLTASATNFERSGQMDGDNRHEFVLDADMGKLYAWRLLDHAGVFAGMVRTIGWAVLGFFESAPATLPSPLAPLRALSPPPFLRPPPPSLPPSFPPITRAALDSPAQTQATCPTSRPYRSGMRQSTTAVPVVTATAWRSPPAPTCPPRSARST